MHAASWTTLVPADHILETHLDGNVRIVTYSFGTDPLGFYNYSGQTGTFISSVSLPIVPEYQPPITYGIYPLGKYCEGGYSLNSGSSGGIAIDVTDFKKDAILDISSRFYVDLLLGHGSTAGSNADEHYTIGVVWSFFTYASNGDFLGYHDTSSASYAFTIQDEGGFNIYAYDINQICPLSAFHDDVTYIVPIINVTLTRIDDPEGVDVRSVYFTFEDFTLSVGTDMLLEQSLTLEAIESELGELNDKTDTIIDGTDGMNEQIDDMSGVVQDQDEQLELVEDVEKEYLDAWSETNETYNNVILNFLKGKGWVQLGLLLKPILTWEHSVTIMVLVVAFVNLSVIFFGR